MRAVFRWFHAAVPLRANKLRAALLLLLAPAILTGCDRISALRGPDAAEARALAKQAYIEAYPLIVSYGAMYNRHIDGTSGQYIGPFNQVIPITKFASPADRATANPNNDVIVATLLADLRAEPIVLCMPTMTSDRYYSVQFVDMNMFDFGSADKRKHVNTAGCVLLTGPRFAGLVPTGIRQVLRSSTDFATVIYRTQVTNAADLDLATQLQAGYTVQPLSAFLTTGALPPAIVEPVLWRPYSDTALGHDFVPMFNFLLQFSAYDKVANLDRMDRIGIGPKARTKYDALSADIKTAIDAGVADAKAAIAAKAKTLEIKDNGWQIAAPFGPRSFFKGDDLLRAAATYRAPFAPDPTDALFLVARSDAKGVAFDASARTYTLTFAPGTLPPVHGFWSISLYDARTHAFVENSLNRYLVNDEVVYTMAPNADGSLTLYIQPNSPGPDHEANWLPAPPGPFELVLRMYMPTPERPSIFPLGHGTWSPPAVVPAS